MHVELHQRLIADADEAVDLAGLDHQYVARAGLEFHESQKREGYLNRSATASKNFQSSITSPPVGFVCALQTTITRCLAGLM